MEAPWRVSLPTALSVGGEEVPIRTDYRVALDCFLALTDNELTGEDKIEALLTMLYERPIAYKDYKEAVEKAFWYLRCGEDERPQKSPQLVDWEQDFNIICSPISEIIGKDIRGVKHLHWWSFISAYMAIGDCLFAQVVRIRDQKARGKKLDKADAEFYRRNKDIIDIKHRLTFDEQESLKKWM